MKFDEVTTQFVLTGHVVGYDVLTVSSKAWDELKPEQQARFRAAAEKAIDDYTVKFEAKEHDAVAALRPKARRSTRPTSTPSATSRRSATSTSTAATGRTGRWSASTRSSPVRAGA